MTQIFSIRARVEMIKRWENIQLEYFGFMKDDEGNWVENQLYIEETILMGSRQK